MKFALLLMTLLGTPPDFQEQVEQALQNLASEFHYDRLKGFWALDRLGVRALENLAQNPPEEVHPQAFELLERLVKKHPCEAGVKLALLLAERQGCPALQLRLLVTAYRLAGRLKNISSQLRGRVKAIPTVIEKRFGKNTLFDVLVRLAIPEVVKAIEELRGKGYLQGSFPGQFARLKEVAGSAAQHALLVMLKKSIEGHAEPNWPGTDTLVKALLDVADKAVLPRLKALYRRAGKTHKPDIEVLLYRLGERRPLLERLEKMEKRARAGDMTTLYKIIFLAGRAGIYSLAEKYQRLKMRRYGAAATDHYNLACYLSMQGKIDEALAELEKAFKGGYRDLAWMEKDAEIAAARRDPRFKKLLKKYIPEALQNGEKDEKKKDEKKEEEN